MEFKKGIIKKIEEISGFRRLTIEGKPDEVKEMQEGGYIKVIADFSGGKTVARTISIAKVEGNTFILDFVDHHNQGPVSDWQRNAVIGGNFYYKGPGLPSRLDFTGDNFFFFGDLTAFPAINAHIRNISLEKKVILFTNGNKDIASKYFDRKVEVVEDIGEILSMAHNSGEENDCLWAAGEREMVKNVRDFTKTQKKNFLSVYISSYWQKGVQDEEHKKAKIKG